MMVLLFNDDGIVKSLCIILPQMSGYIKYFDDGGKNRSFKIEDVFIKLLKLKFVFKIN